MPRVARDVPCARRRALLTFKQRRRNLAAPCPHRRSQRRTLMRNVRAVALVLLAGMLAAACGARLPSSERRQAAAAILNAGSGAVASGQLPGDGVATPGTGPVPGSGPVSGGGPGSNRGQPRSQTRGGTQTGGGSRGVTQAGSSCPTGGTDVGLTSNSVKIG